MGIVDLKWQNVHSDGTIDEVFASANVYYGDAAEWLKSWVPTGHLIQGRIQTLELLAEEGTATRFSHRMAYTLFANNLVNYADKYRGMQSVVLHEFEAFADVVLSTEKGGTWTIPPYFIDSVAHLAGFIMNVSDAVDTKSDFCVTPGWRSMRFARPLVAGGRYLSYVKMIPTLEDPTVYFGDVYILQDGAIIGIVAGIQFRRYPRILLNRFFSAPDKEASKPRAAAAPAAITSSEPAPVHLNAASKAAVVTQAVPMKPSPADSISTAAAILALTDGVKPNLTASVDSDSVTVKAIAIIASEAALELADFDDEASFADLGVDSLMSLVIAEKFRQELGVIIGGSLFLDYPTIGDLRSWLKEYHS